MKILATFFVLSILAILAAPLYVTVDGVPLAQAYAQSVTRIPSIQETRGARLLAWNIEGTREFSVFIPFDAAMFREVRRAFKAFEVARALGITDARFEHPVTVQIEFGGPAVTGTLHINAFDNDTPRVWFEFMNPTLCFSDSLAFSQVFPEVKR